MPPAPTKCERVHEKEAGKEDGDELPAQERGEGREIKACWVRCAPSCLGHWA